MIRLILALNFFIWSALAISANADGGKQAIGKLKVSLYFATDGEANTAGGGRKIPDSTVLRKFRKSPRLHFKEYRLLGDDVQTILRSYENWIAPLKPSEEILLSFEPRGEPRDQSLALDLEFWQGKRKVMKLGPRLTINEPLYILGPSWRGGKLIIAIELHSLTSTK